jgi:hypothetical protein
MRLWLAAAIFIGVAGGAARAAPDAGLPFELRPYYYDRLLTDHELGDDSAGVLRLLRNTIYAHAGRTFKDPDVRQYFEAKPWYHARPEPAPLSAIDEANLRLIRRWEAKRVEDRTEDGNLKLAEIFRSRTGTPERPPCTEADARGVLADPKDESQLGALAARLRWTRLTGEADDLPSYLDQRARLVRLGCLPDLDGDGRPESLVVIVYPHRQDLDDPGAGRYPESLEMIFLVSGKRPSWRAVAPLATSGTELGVEGRRTATVAPIRLPDGGWLLEVKAGITACGEEGCDSEETTRFALRHGKLVNTAAHPAR